MEVTCGIYLYSLPLKKLLICHATRSPNTNWSIPKGLKDEGESSFTAGLRELYEETGIDLQHLQIKPSHIFQPVKYPKRNKWLESFLVIVKDDLEGHRFVCHTWVDNKFPEIDKWEWVSLEEAEKRLHGTQSKNITELRKILENLA